MIHYQFEPNIPYMGHLICLNSFHVGLKSFVCLNKKIKMKNIFWYIAPRHDFSSSTPRPGAVARHQKNDSAECKICSKNEIQSWFLNILSSQLIYKTYLHVLYFQNHDLISCFAQIFLCDISTNIWCTWNQNSDFYRFESI